MIQTQGSEKEVSRKKKKKKLGGGPIFFFFEIVVQRGSQDPNFSRNSDEVHRNDPGREGVMVRSTNTGNGPWLPIPASQPPDVTPGTRPLP